MAINATFSTLASAFGVRVMQARKASARYPDCATRKLAVSYEEGRALAWKTAHDDLLARQSLEREELAARFMRDYPVRERLPGTAAHRARVSLGMKSFWQNDPRADTYREQLVARSDIMRAGRHPKREGK